MVISDRLRYVFIEVPKTASSSTRDWLIRNYDGRMHDWYHSTSIPERARDYHTFCVVRNPVERAISLWSWTVRQQAKHYPGLRESLGDDPNDFVQKWLGEDRWRDYPYPKLRAMFIPQDEFLGDVLLNQIFKFTEIPHRYEELPFVDSVTGFGHKNAGMKKANIVLSNESLAAIRKWDPAYSCWDWS